MVKLLLNSIVDEPSYDWCDDDPDIMAALNETESDFLFAAQTGKPANKFKKRAGAKAVKAFEREVGAVDKLGPDDATTFRAISARSNYLAQDRPDASYSSKELCRAFSQPNGQYLIKKSAWGAILQANLSLCASLILPQPQSNMSMFIATLTLQVAQLLGVLLLVVVQWSVERW